MAASVMLSRFAGSNCLKRVLGRTVLTHRYLISCSGSKNLYLCSVSDSLRLSALCRSNGTSATASASFARGQNLRPSVRNEEAKKVSETADSVTVQLSTLDDQVRRTGRVEIEQVQQVLDLIVNAGTATTQQGVMLLHCAGALLVKSTAAERIALCDKICETLHRVGVEFNIQMYNALLKAKLENGQAFSPVDMLTEIEVTKQLVPNRVTYQLLLSQFCEEGNIDGASKVLEHMKNQGMPLNENVLNALVRGHIVKGDMTGAQEVMTNMAKAGLDPTGNTYAALMCGVAEKGDLAGIKKILDEVSASEVYISPANMYNVVIALADKGHQQHIPEILEYIRAHFRPGKYNHDTLNCVYRLITGGHDDAAFTVFSKFDFRSGYADEEGTKRLSHNLLRCMIIRARPIDKILDIFTKLKSENLAGEDTLEFIAFVALKFQRADYALEVVSKLKSLGFNVKSHFFWPVLNDAARQSDIDGVLHVVRQMTVDSEPGQLVGAVYRWGVKSLLDNGQKLEQILAKLKETGFSDADLQVVQTSSLVSQGSFDEAVELINKGAKTVTSILKAESVNGFVNSGQNVDGLIKLLLSVQQHSGRESLDEFNHGIFLGLVKQRRIKLDVIQKIVNSMSEHSLKLPRKYRQSMRSELQARGASNELLQKLDQLLVDGSKISERAVDYSAEELKKASLDDLTSWLEKAKAEGRPTQKLEKWLLHRYCFEGKVQEAEALKASLENKGFVFKEESLRQLGVLAARDKQNLDEALRYKHELESRHPSFGGYVNLVMYIVQLQLAGDKYDDALATLKDYSSQHGDVLRSQGYAEGYMMSEITSKLIQTCCEKNDVARSVELLSLLFDSGYVKSGAFDVLSQLVSGYINKSDDSGAVAALEHCVTRYHKAPQYSSVFRHLIAKEDASLLQKAVDLVTSIEGEMHVLLHLSACFVECGKVKQARKILETPGIRAQMMPLKDACQRFISQNKEKELEQFVEITKNLAGIQRGQMLLQLIRFHARKRDAKKMLEAFSLFEEEHILPDRGVLSYVAKVLQSLGQPVPFEIPQEVQSKPQRSPGNKAGSKSTDASSTTSKQETVERIEETIDATKLLEMKAQMSGSEFSNFITNTVKKMLKRNEREALRKLIYQLSQAGDVDSILVVQKLLPKSFDIYGHQQLLIAHAYRNTADQVLDSLTENVADVRKYLSVGALKLLAERSPEQAARFEKLANECAEKTNSPVVVGYLYSYYILNNQWDKVKQLLQKFDSLKSKIRQAYVCRLAKARKEEDTLKQIVELHRNDDKRALITPYSSLLLLKCEQGSWSDAIECYNSAISRGLLFDDFWVRSLQALQSLALSNKQPVPWQAGALEKKAAEDTEARRRRRFTDASSSSSSDSSDSDKEDKRN